MKFNTFYMYQVLYDSEGELKCFYVHRLITRMSLSLRHHHRRQTQGPRTNVQPRPQTLSIISRINELAGIDIWVADEFCAVHHEHCSTSFLEGRSPSNE